MKAEGNIFERVDPDAQAAAEARAEADVTAGRVVDHAKVKAWLARWGTPDEAPAPPEWLR